MSLNYVAYLGEMDLNMDSVQKTMEDAKTLQVVGLVKHCEKLLRQDINKTNCITVLISGQKLGSKDMFDAAFCYLLVSFLFCCPKLDN